MEKVLEVSGVIMFLLLFIGGGVSFLFYVFIYLPYKFKKRWEKADPSLEIQAWRIIDIPTISGPLERKIILAESTIGDLKRNSKSCFEIPDECSLENPIVIVTRGKSSEVTSLKEFQKGTGSIPEVDFEQLMKEIRMVAEGIQKYKIGLAEIARLISEAR